MRKKKGRKKKKKKTKKEKKQKQKKEQKKKRRKRKKKRKPKGNRYGLKEISYSVLVEQPYFQTLKPFEAFPHRSNFLVPCGFKTQRFGNINTVRANQLLLWGTD